MAIQKSEHALADSLSHNWWALALRGLAAVVFGVVALFLPSAAVAVLVLFFGAYVLWDGIFGFIAGLRSKGERRWALVLEGMVGIIAGLLALIWPDIAAVSLIFIIAAWAIITGVMEIIAAIRLRKEIEGELFLMLGGALSVIFGVLAMMQPAAGLLAVTWMIAVYAILFGILLIILGIRLRTWNRRLLARSP